MSDLINLTENTHLRFREDGGIFLAKYYGDVLHALTLTSDELKELTSYLQTK